MDGSFSMDGIAGWDEAFLKTISTKLERYHAMQLELIKQPDISAKQAMLVIIEDLEAEIIREALFRFSPDDLVYMFSRVVAEAKQDRNID